MSRTELTAIDIVLRDGSTLLVRDLTPDDRDKLQHLFAQLSHDSLYFRFFRIPAVDVEITRLFAAGPDDAVLVAETDSRLVAVASWIRDRTKTDRAEVAFAIADVAQGKGIGTALLEALADRGRGEGLDKFDAYVLSTNDRMMRVFLDSGFTLSQELDAGVFRVTLALKETPEHETRAAARARRAAAASIKPFCEPRSVAVVGASRERGKIGAELLHNLIATGYTGKLCAVHPSATSIDGIPAYARVTEIPDDIDLALVSVPAGQVAAVVDDCIQKHVRAIVVISAGFSETNEAGRARELELVHKVRRAGIRMVGPNCLGVLNTNSAIRLNATFSSVFPPAGAVAMSSQSGALGLAILHWAKRLNIGLSTFISVGNKADVSGNDLLQYWAEDPHTQVILLYLESFGNPRKFSQIARRVARSKPIVAVKAGRSQAGARAAASHTGALVSNDAIVEALFRQCGVIRTSTMEELFDVAAVIANQPVPRGPRVGILTNAGGPGILAADACEANGLQLPALADTTCQSLRSFLPTTATIANPVDMIASASAAQYERALTALLADEYVDSVLVIFIPPLVTRGEDVARAIQRAAKTGPDKPVVAVFLSSEPGDSCSRRSPASRFPKPHASHWPVRPPTVSGEHDPPVLSPSSATSIDRERRRSCRPYSRVAAGGRHQRKRSRLLRRPASRRWPGSRPGVRRPPSLPRTASATRSC
jgi:acetate---CoA ligase (ADP-forming)